MTATDDFIRHMQNQDPAELDHDRDEAWGRQPGPRFIVEEFGPRDYAVRDTATQRNYDARFTRKAAQEAADRRNAAAAKETP